MTDEERDRIKAEAFKEANLEQRLKSVEDSIGGIERAVTWFFRAIWGGVAYLLTQIASFLFSNGWPK